MSHNEAKAFFQDVSLLKRHINYMGPEYPHLKENRTTKVGWAEPTIQEAQPKGVPKLRSDEICPIFLVKKTRRLNKMIQSSLSIVNPI